MNLSYSIFIPKRGE